MNVTQQSISLHTLTTLRVGGLATHLCEVRTPAELSEASRYFVQNKGTLKSFFVLGEGSNTLASDIGYSGLVLRMLMRGVRWREITDSTANEKVEVVAGAGEHWDDLVGLAVAKGFYGLENLSGIPGSVGAAPVQNIGAYGAEVKDTVAFVEAFHFETGETRIFTPEECCFGYRDSFFKSEEGRKWVIVKVGFVLDKKGRVNIGYKDLKVRFAERYSSQVSLVEVRDAVLEIRKHKLPDIALLGTAGSFFKNPIIRAELYKELQEEYPAMPGFVEGDGRVKVPLAWILDNICGLKGWKNSSNRVGLYEKQPLALVNFGDATAREVVEAANMVALVVKNKTGIDIEWEVQRLGVC